MAAKGVFASSVLSIMASWIIKGLGLISTVILARLLTPEDFGSVAICMLVIYFFNLLSTTGTRAYILSLTEVTPQDINSAWTLDLLAKSAISLLVVFLSPFIAGYFNNEALGLPIAVCALIPLISGAENPRLNLLRRSLEYTIIFRINVTAKVVSFIVTIALAFYLKSYWALIIGSITSVSIIMLLGYYLYPYKPTFDTSKFSVQWKFSKWIFFKAFIGYARARSDTFILAKFFSLSDVGFFNIAKELGLLVYEQVALPTSDIIMSGIKKSGTNVAKVTETIECYLVLIISVILPASIGVFVLSGDLVLVLLGEKWTEAGTLLKPLSIMGFFVGATAVLTASMNALRKVKSTFYLEFIIALFAVGILYSYRETDVFTFSIIVSLIGLVTFILYLGITFYYVRLSLIKLIVAIAPITISTLFMFMCVQEVKTLHLVEGVIKLLISIVVGILSYATCFYLFLVIMSDKSTPLKLIKSKVDVLSLKIGTEVHRAINLNKSK